MVCATERSRARALSSIALKRSSALLMCLYEKSRTCRISDASWSVRVGDAGAGAGEEEGSEDEGLGGCRMGVGSYIGFRECYEILLGDSKPQFPYRGIGDERLTIISDEGGASA